MEEQLLNWYNCLPPWFPNNNGMHVCRNNAVLDSQTLSDIRDDFVNFIDGMESMNIFKTCLPPCLTMKVNMRRTFASSFIDSTFYKFVAREEVKVVKDEYAYDAFNLVVDLGSALGLWLGLSALSIFDLLISGILMVWCKYKR